MAPHSDLFDTFVDKMTSDCKYLKQDFPNKTDAIYILKERHKISFLYEKRKILIN